MIDLDEIESRINEGILRRHVGAQDDAFSALAVLLAEVKRLRGEAVAQALLASVIDETR